MRFAGRMSLIVMLAAIAAPALGAESVKIGAAFSMTGPAAVYGATQKTGVLAAIDEVNKAGTLKGVKLEAIIEDDASTKEQGIAVYQRFINRDRVAAMARYSLAGALVGLIVLLLLGSWRATVIVWTSP